MPLTDRDVQAAADDIDSLAQIVEFGRGALLRNGDPLYAPAEHERRTLALESKFDEEIQEHEETAAAAVQAARDQLTLIDDADPRGFDRFTHEDMAIVNSAWLPVAERDVARLPIAEIETRCHVILARGDKHIVAAYTAALWWHVASMAEGPERGRAALLLSELTDRMADPKKAEKKQAVDRQLALALDLRRKISATSERIHQRERLAAVARFGPALG